MELLILIIVGVWGSIILTGMVLTKLERVKFECWLEFNCLCDCEDEENNEIEEIK